MDTVADLYRRAALIERALDDLDVEEQMPGADLAVIEAEREMRRR